MYNITKGDKQIHLGYFPDRIKPGMFEVKDNVHTHLAYFRDEEAMLRFLELMKFFCDIK